MAEVALIHEGETKVIEDVSPKIPEIQRVSVRKFYICVPGFRVFAVYHPNVVKLRGYKGTYCTAPDCADSTKKSPGRKY